MPFTYEDTLQGERRNALTIPSATGEVMREQFAQSFEENPILALKRFADLAEDKVTGPRLSAEAARAKLKDAGLENDLVIGEGGITEAALSTLMERKRVEKRRQDIFARAEGGIGEGAARLGVGFLTTLTDPISAGLNFVPVAGQVRYARWLSTARSLGGRLAVRGAVGAAEGVAGAAIAEIPIYAMRTQEQADYDMADSLLNVAFGGVIGAGLHTTVGTAAELISRRLPQRQPSAPRTEPVIGDLPSRAPELPADIQRAIFDTPQAIESMPPLAQQAALREAVAQAVEGRPIEVVAMVRSSLDETRTPEFRAWFGESQVTDRSGNPMVLYHGTREREAILDAGFRPSKDGGIYFTDRPLDALKFGREFKRGETAPKVMKAALRLENPHEVNAGGEVFEPSMLDDAIAEARAAGNDGVIVRDIVNFEGAEPSTTYVAFRPDQVRGLREGIDRPRTEAATTPDPEYLSAAEHAETTLAREGGVATEGALKAADKEAQLAMSDVAELGKRLSVDVKSDPEMVAVIEGAEKAERWARAAELATVCLVRGG